MPVDPAIQKVLDQINAFQGPPLDEIPPTVFRAQQMTIPEDIIPVKEVNDVVLPLEGRNIGVRVYTPDTAGEAPRPALVYYHGGGWVIGNLDSHDSVCRLLANEGHCVVISVDYRLAPESKFPAAVDDAYDALVYVAQHAEEFGIDSGRIAVGGDSAGGNLAAVTSIIAKEHGGTPPIQFQLLIYPSTGYVEEPPSIRENAEGYLLTGELMLWFRKHYLRDQADYQNPYFAPILSGNLKGLPPAFIATAQYDPLRDVGQLYAEALRDNGVEVTANNYEGLIHGFAHYHSFSERSKSAMLDCANALKTALKA